MKKLLFICITSLTFLLNAKNGEYAYEMGYYSPDTYDAYSPNIYRGFKSDVVYTKQLEIQEYTLQRLDWLHLNIDKLGNKIKTIDAIVKNTDAINDIDQTVDISVRNIEALKLIAMGVVLLLIIIAVILCRILQAINKNMKLLQNCIQSE
ncbi:MAG: hypothetical protein J6Q84_07580 [Kiritimatiellae bacterium]|nr:hypothetical protein [Kiritimatiellia bacterium]